MSSILQGLKVNRAINGTTTVNSNCYAIVSYGLISITAAGNYNSLAVDTVINVYFGPGQPIPTSRNELCVAAVNGGGSTTVTAVYAIESGVEFINT